MSESQHRLHFALLPSAGMGHVAPFCRLAAALSSRGCSVTIIVPQPTVSSAESLHISRLLASFPDTIRSVPFPLADLDPSLFPSDSDPFYLRYEALRRSSHLLSPLLSSSRFSALIIDIGLTSAFVPLANSLHLPSYILFTASAAMLAFYAYFPTYISNNPSASAAIGDVDVPGLRTIPRSSVIPFLHAGPDHFFFKQFVTNSLSFPQADGILINTFEAIEADALAALNDRRVTPDLPPVLAIGPLKPVEQDSDCHISWLDGQPTGSVVYVSFGSRTAMRREQIEQLGIGLERSRCRFLWVIKTKKVDRDEQGVDLEELIGKGYVERVKERGMVVNGWVEQERILGHRAIGGFLSHCGWNSAMEAATAGVRVMAWPRGADQRMNGEVVRRTGLGVWMEEWSWEAEEGVVSGDEIAMRVKEMMEDEELGRSAARVAVEARKAVEAGGSSDKVWDEFIAKVASSRN